MSGFSKAVPRARWSARSNSDLRRIRTACISLAALNSKFSRRVAVGTGDADLLAVLGDFLVHEFLQFGLAFLQTAPGDDERFALFLGLFAADQTLQIRIKLDDPGHEGALGQFVENRAEHEAAHRVARDSELGAGKDIGDQ